MITKQKITPPEVRHGTFFGLVGIGICVVAGVSWEIIAIFAGLILVLQILGKLKPDYEYIENGERVGTSYGRHFR